MNSMTNKTKLKKEKNNHVRHVCDYASTPVGVLTSHFL